MIGPLDEKNGGLVWLKWKKHYICGMNWNHLPYEYLAVEDALLASFERGHRLALTSQCGLFFCQCGWIDVSLNDQIFHLQEGDLYYYMPSTFVCIMDHSDDLRGIGMKSQLDFVLPMLEKVFNGGNVLVMREHPCISLNAAQRNSLESLVELIRERKRQWDEEGPNGNSTPILQRMLISLGESLFYEVLFNYATNQSLQPRVYDAGDRIFQAFLVSLFNHYKAEREVAYYAAEQCLTPRYFSSVIKEKSGHSALQWIIQMVISSARQMLVSSDLTIKEIASEFNFPSQSFFGKYFKQYVGLSPKEFRLQERLAKK